MKRKTFWKQIKKNARTIKALHPEIVPHLNGLIFSDVKGLKSLVAFVLKLFLTLILLEEAKCYVINTYSDDVSECMEMIQVFLTRFSRVNLALSVAFFSLLLWWLKHVWDDIYLSLKRWWLTILIVSMMEYISLFFPIKTVFGWEYFRIASSV